MEREPQNYEKLESPESHSELNEAASERLRELERQAETEPDRRSENLESARRVIERHVEPEPVKTEHEALAPPATRLDKLKAYTQTLTGMQKRLPGASRSFSKIIHTPVIEKTSEALGQTVLRPSVSLGACTGGLIVGGFFYLIAKRYGYTLSGSEFVLSLLVGGIIGLGVEFLFKLFRRPKA